MKRSWKVMNEILNKDHSEIVYIKDNENVYEDDKMIIEINANIP